MSATLIPIFPLEQVVLFPRVRCPLHIFEPRYRQLTEVALEGGRRIGMVTVLPDEVGEMAGDPPVFPVGCEGRIVESARLADGRYNIVLLGERRFRILEEPPRPRDRLYRAASVEFLEEQLGDPEGEGLAALRTRSLELLAQLLEHMAPGASRRLARDLFADADEVTLVNTLCQLVDLAPAEKQGLLEAPGLAERARGLVSLLEFRLAELEGAAAPASRSVH